MNKGLIEAMEEDRKMEEFITSLSSAIGKALFTTKDGNLGYAETIVVNGEQNIISTTLSDGSVFDIRVKERKKQEYKSKAA